MVNYPCECCGYQTISRAGAHPWVCATCIRIYKGMWKPGPGQMSREEVTERLEALFKQYEPDAVKACKAYWNEFERKLEEKKAERRRRWKEGWISVARLEGEDMEAEPVVLVACAPM